MKNIYLTIVIVCIAFILILCFQNLILNSTAFILFLNTNSFVLAFLVATVGFVAGASFILYYNSRRKGEEDEDSIE